MVVILEFDIEAFSCKYNSAKLDDGDKEFLELAAAEDLTHEELETTWRIEQWVNTKIPQLISQSELSSRDFRVPCRVQKSDFLSKLSSRMSPCSVRSETGDSRCFALPREVLASFDELTEADGEKLKDHKISKLGSSPEVIWSRACQNHCS